MPKGASKKRCSLCNKKLRPAQCIMARCRCDFLVCAACKSEHIMKCSVRVDMLPAVEALSSSTLKEKI